MIRIFRRIICIVFVLAMAFTFYGCADEKFDGSIDFTFYGVWILDGETQSEMTFSLQGMLPAKFEHQSTVEMDLNFIWPESSGYLNEGMQTYTGGAEYAMHNDQPIYHGGGIVYGDSQNSSHIMSYTIFPAEEYIVLKIDGRYLVAATDPDADPAAILDLYKQYVRTS